MKKEMLINVSEGEECRIALLEDGMLEELYMERTSATSHVGNIYKGRVTNVEPSIQAAFIDFGLGRNGFLHISDLMPTYFGRNGEDIRETVGRKMARRDRPPIQRCLRRGDDIVVQIIKEGIGTKGPTLTTYLSVPGRILVMMPGLGKMGVSRKIEDEEERRRLRQILDSLKPPKDVGFIIRTAGIGKSKTEIQRDLTYLTRLWQTLEKKRDSGPGPLELYTEGDLVTRTVRDFFSNEIDAIVVDNKEVAQRVKEVIKLANPRTKNRVELYEDPVPLFHRFGIERDIELMYSRHVPLPSGGSLVIDSTEAVVAIDVNSGKFREHSDAETTAFKTDMEAADEIPRQLRLRDLGGVIICDFIDLRYERHRRELERRLHDNFKNDRAKTKVLGMSQFGIIEMTRQRMRPSLKRSIYFDCPHCKGAGLVKTPESMSLDVMRRLAIAVHDQRVVRVEMAVCADVAFYLQNRKRQQIAELENRTNKHVVLRADPTLGLDEMRLELFDNRDGLVIIDQLSAVLAPQPHRTQLGQRPIAGPAPVTAPVAAQRNGGRFDNRGGRPAPPRRLPPPPPRSARDEESFDRDDEPDNDFEDREDQADDQGAEPMVANDRQPDRDAADRDIDSESTADNDDREPAASDASPDGPGDAGDNGEGGPRRRRRRRRGRRGRGRGQRDDAGQDLDRPAAGAAPGPRDPSAEADGNAEDARDQDLSPERENSLDSDDLDASDNQEQIASSDRRRDRTNTDAESHVETEEATLADTDDEIGQAPTEIVDIDATPVAAAPLIDDLEDEGPGPGNEKFPTGGGAEVDSEDAGPKKRRRRGGRGRRRTGAAAAESGPGDAPDGTPEAVAPPVKAPPTPRQSRSAPAPSRVPPRREEPAPKPPRPAPVVIPRTGSTDRHLANDEPILPQPLSRPRSYSDLDSIPDDLDDR